MFLILCFLFFMLQFYSYLGAINNYHCHDSHFFYFVWFWSYLFLFLFFNCFFWGLVMIICMSNLFLYGILVFDWQTLNGHVVCVNHNLSFLTFLLLSLLCFCCVVFILLILDFITAWCLFSLLTNINVNLCYDIVHLWHDFLLFLK